MSWLLGGGVALMLFMHVIIEVDWTQSIVVGLIGGILATLSEGARQKRGDR